MFNYLILFNITVHPFAIIICDCVVMKVATGASLSGRKDDIIFPLVILTLNRSLFFPPEVDI